MAVTKLVLLRHGESVWNKENKFTGWTDVALSEKGKGEAQKAGVTFEKEGYSFDKAFTSVLKRAIHTLWLALEEMDLMWIPVERAWQLNERHYGDLQGLNKSEMAQKFGEEQILIWRRSYDVCPPALEETDERNPAKDLRYQSLGKGETPLTESLALTVKRVVPYWENVIKPDVQKGQRILIVAHGNSLRALVKHLDDISDEDILKLNIPTGVPLVYDLDSDLKPIKHYYLGDPKEIEKAAAAVANQGKK